MKLPDNNSVIIKIFDCARTLVAKMTKINTRDRLLPGYFSLFGTSLCKTFQVCLGTRSDVAGWEASQGNCSRCTPSTFPCRYPHRCLGFVDRKSLGSLLIDPVAPASSRQLRISRLLYDCLENNFFRSINEGRVIPVRLPVSGLLIRKGMLYLVPEGWYKVIEIIDFQQLIKYIERSSMLAVFN